MKKLFSITLILCLFLAGCTKYKFASEDKFATLRLSPELNVATTKATIDDAVIINEDVRVQVSKADGTTPYIGADAKFILSHDGSVWNMSSALYLSSDNATIYAYAPTPVTPADIETGGYSSLQIELDIPASQNMAEQVDYLWSCQSTTAYDNAIDINNTNSIVNLRLNHALTQVAFVFYTENYSGSGVINSIRITDASAIPTMVVNKDVTNDLVLNINDGSFSGGQTSTYKEVLAVGSTIGLSANPGTDPEVLNDEVNGYILLTPFTAVNKSDITFTFNIDSKDYSVTLSGADGINWLAGHQYIYTVRLTGTQIDIQGVTVAPWQSHFEDDIVIN
ncbi:MAG: fimbrillin family protein [Bacteroidales bacterium]|nr:fimbrillin family protein [Bacteroidales bacterium]